MQAGVAVILSDNMKSAYTPWTWVGVSFRTHAISTLCMYIDNWFYIPYTYIHMTAQSCAPGAGTPGKYPYIPLIYVHPYVGTIHDV